MEALGHRFQALVDAFTDFLFVCSAEGRLLTDMPAWRRVTGQTEAELLGFGWLDGVHPDDRERTKRVWDEAVASGGTYVVEYRIVGPGGERHLDVRGAPVRDDDGTIVEWVGSCTDVTEHRRMAAVRARLERDLRDERETLRLVVERTRTAVVLLRGPRFVFSHFNDAYAAMVPAGRAQIGVPMTEALPETAHLEPHFARVLDGEPLEFRELPIAFDGPHAFDGFRYYDVSYTPVTFADDERGVLGVGVEVTDEVRRRSDLERRLAEERRLGTDLQRALLPETVPALDGLDMAVRYEPAQDRIGVGGDWYDVIAVAEDRVVLAIGDVAGNGIAAATAMAQLRAALRAHALEGLPPGAMLDRTSAFLTRLELADMATAAVVALRPSTGRLTWASAGHPPPLLVPPVGVGRLLWADAQPPLGSPAAPYAEHEDELPPDGSLVLYTDGLVEQRRVTLDVTLEELRRAARGTWTTAGDLRDVLVRRMPGRGEDDVALLVCRRPGGMRVHRRFDGVPEAVAQMRELAAGAAIRAGLDAGTVERVRLATSEAATNAVMHAPRGTTGIVDVSATVAEGELLVLVVDDGQGVTPRPDSPGAGVGVQIMEAVCDRVEWQRPEGGGTAVRMAFRLPTRG